MGLVLGISDHVVVLEFGQVIARGTPAEMRSNPRVVEAYLGSAASVATGDAPPETMPAVADHGGAGR